MTTPVTSLCSSYLLLSCLWKLLLKMTYVVICIAYKSSRSDKSIVCIFMTRGA